MGARGGKSKNAKTGASGGAVELDAKLGQGGGGYYPTMGVTASEDFGHYGITPAF